MTRSAGFYRFGLSILAIAVLATAAYAQPPEGGGGRRGGRGGPAAFRGLPGGGGSFGLLMHPQVRGELDLTEEQLQELSGLREKMVEQFRSMGINRETLANLSDEQRRAKIQEFREKSEKFTDEMIEKALTPAQLERLQQINWQQQGVGALRDEEIVEALDITQEQQAKLGEISEQAREQIVGVFQALAGFRDMSQEDRVKKFEELRANSEKYRREAEAKSMAVLTEEQKKTLGELMGEPFVLEQQERGRLRGGRVRGSGRGGRQPSRSEEPQE